MGRTICLWLIAFLALGSTIPVPEQASQQELIDRILNAKPEDNDIDRPLISYHPLISESKVEGQVPATSDDPQPQESNIPEGEKEEEILPPSETTQEVSDKAEVQQVPEQEPTNGETDNVQDEQEPESVSNVDQTQLNQDDSLLVPEEEVIQVQPEEEPVQINPYYKEKLFPLPEEQQVTFDEDEQIMPVPVEDIYYVVDEEEAMPELVEERLPFDEDEQVMPVPVEELYYVVDEEEAMPVLVEEQVPFDEDEQVMPVPVEEIYSVFDEEEAIFVPEEEHSFDVIEEEQIVPVYEEEVPVEFYEEQPFPFRDETVFQPDSQDTMIMNFGNEEETSFEEETPFIEEPEDFRGAIMVNLDETELGQPIQEEPIMPGFVYEEPQEDDVMTLPEEDESIFGSFVPPYFGEEPQPGEILVMHDESQGPVYFESFDDSEPIPVEVFEVPEGNLEVPVEMPVEQMPPFAISDINENPFINSEILSFEVQPAGYPYEEDDQPLDVMEEYYIPNEEILVDDDPETSFFENESEVYIIDDRVPDVQEDTVVSINGPIFEVFPTSQVMPEVPSEEPFIIEETDLDYDHTFEEADLDPFNGEDITYADTTDMIMDYPVLDSGVMIDEDLPFQNGDLMPMIDQQNIHGPAEFTKTVFMIEPHGFEENSEEPIIEIIHIDDLPQNSGPFPFAPPFVNIERMNSEMPEVFSEYDVQQIIENEQIVPIAEFPEMDDTHIINEEGSYFLPRNPIREPIIFPEEMPPRHNLPVFPYQWSENNFFRSPNDGPIHINDPTPSYGLPNDPSALHDHPSDSSYNSPPPFQGPSYGPPLTDLHSFGPPSNPSYNGPLPFQVPSFDPSSENLPSNYFPQRTFMMEQPQSMFDMPNDDMSPQMPDMPRSEVSDLDDFDDEDFNMNDPTDHFHFSSDFYQNSRDSNVLKRFSNFDSFEQPSLPEITYQQDFQGPNRFPLNFRESDYTPNFNPYKQRIMAQSMNQENLHKGFASHQPFQQGPSSPGAPNSMPVSPNTFLPMFGEAAKMMRNPSDESMNMNLQVFDTSSMPVNPSNANQRQQQYDVQVSFIPYEASFNFQPKNGHGHFDARYPSAHQPSSFNTYQEFPYSFSTYGEPAPYQQAGLYPPQIQSRYAMDYNYRDQFDHYHPYNYPTPAW